MALFWLRLEACELILTLMDRVSEVELRGHQRVEGGKGRLEELKLWLVRFDRFSDAYWVRRVERIVCEMNLMI